MRLIDADALAKCFTDWVTETNSVEHYSVADVVRIIENAPTVTQSNDSNALNVLERKKGKWIHGREIGREMIGDCITAIFYEEWKCSACGCTVEEERQPLWHFCPNCGAKMERRSE